jgi:D-alanyl-lipoteichoic acid acyltransferase DltB (MBOAT superfamily)
LRQVLWGLVQKVMLADNLASIVDACYEGTCSGPLLLVSTVAFAFQIYWDFAGYSNIAIGTARLFGFSLTRNFAYPYFSRSIAEFWRRWHITLSTWFRDYVYVPLGGNRVGRARLAFNVVVTFAVSGLWHGAAWTFVVWGFLNGLLALPGILGKRSLAGPEQVPGSEARWASFHDIVRMLRTFGLVCVGWVFFRAPTLDRALEILATIGKEVLDPRAWSSLGAHADYLRGVLPLVAMAVLLEWIFRRHEHVFQVDRWPRPARLLLYTVVFWGTLYVMREDPTRFVYFQF